MIWADPTPLRVLASLLLWPTQEADGNWFPVLYQGWTLHYEAFFYVCFAATMLLPQQQRLPALTAGFLALIAAVTAVAPALLTASGLTPVMLPEFLAGAWLCRAWQAGRLPGARAGWVMLVAGAIAIILLPHGNVMPWRPLVWSFPALLVVAGALTLESADALPRVPGLRRLGDVSYALYLTHTIVIWAAVPVLRPLPLPLALLGMVAACIATASVVHRVIEQPLTRWLSDRLVPHRTTAQRGVAKR